MGILQRSYSKHRKIAVGKGVQVVWVETIALKKKSII